jgi:hypothetical protein
MTFLARIVRFLFWLLIVSWSIALARRVFGWMLGSAVEGPGLRTRAQAPAAATPEPGTGRRLVRDPVCGVHVAEVLAIPLREGDTLMHFCSVACRDTHVGSVKKMAANG